MHLAECQQDLLSDYLDGFRPLIGDRRTQTLFRGTIEGIIGAQMTPTGATRIIMILS